MSDQPQFERWFKIDLPILQAVVALADEGVQYIGPDEITARTGLDRDTVGRSLLALAHEEPPLFEAPGAHSGWRRQVVAVHSVTGHARRIAGTWPSADALSATLVEQIIKGLADVAKTEGNETKRGKIQSTVMWLGGAGKDVFAEVVGAVIAKQMGV